jgi:hypothetical protein
MDESVIPVKTGIQEYTGFPRIKYGAGLVKPGMTNNRKLMPLSINPPSPPVAKRGRGDFLQTILLKGREWP